jgi:hypothetical protein
MQILDKRRYVSELFTGIWGLHEVSNNNGLKDTDIASSIHFPAKKIHKEITVISRKLLLETWGAVQLQSVI